MFIVYGYQTDFEGIIYGYINHVFCSWGNVEDFMLPTDTCEWIVPGTMVD